MSNHRTIVVNRFGTHDDATDIPLHRSFGGRTYLRIAVSKDREGALAEADEFRMFQGRFGQARARVVRCAGRWAVYAWDEEDR